MESKYSRRKFLEISSFLTAIPGAVASARKSTGNLSTPKLLVEVGMNRQLFIDDYIIEALKGETKLKMHHPKSKELSILFDKPWEGNTCGFACVFMDDNLYRMYYGPIQVKLNGMKGMKSAVPYSICYAESEDGIHWRKPELGLIEFQGSKANNILLDDRDVGVASPFPVSGAVFKDDNPLAPPDARYKWMIRNYSPKRSVPNGLLPMKSPDGIHWTLMSEYPVITDGEFDSQNLAFWDSERKEYRAYWRYKINYVREIRTAVSKDFIHWTNVQDLHFIDSPLEELYTNVVKPYYRSPQIYIGLPVRWVYRGDPAVVKKLPNPKNREARSTGPGTIITESLLMSSRDGHLFNCWNEAFLKPGIERPGTWIYGQQYIAWSMVETKSALEGAPNEISFYAEEGPFGTLLHHPNANGYRRYTLRLDGFVSVNASMKGGEVITKPIVFEGRMLELNFSSSAAGSIQVEIQDENGRPIPGYTLADCPEIFGDSVNRMTSWKHGSDISGLKGKTICLRFALKDADLFAFKFT